MPLDPFKPISFKEGEPFDPNKLNELQTNISSAYNASNVVYNATFTGAQSTPRVPVFKSDQAKLGDLKAGSTTTFPLPADIRTENLPAPHVVATLRNKIGVSHVVTICVHNIIDSPSITIYTSQAIKSCMIDWIAITYKDVAQA